MKTIKDSYDAGRAVVRAQNEDHRRGEFLRAIDGSTETLNDFEARFVGDFLKWSAGRKADLDFQWFTDGRRQVVDAMIHRYGFRSLKSEVQGLKSKLPEAPAGHCGYLVRNGETNRRECCGAKATVTTGRGLELCAEHAATRAAELKQLRDAKNRLRP